MCSPAYYQSSNDPEVADALGHMKGTIHYEPKCMSYHYATGKLVITESNLVSRTILKS